MRIRGAFPVLALALLLACERPPSPAPPKPGSTPVAFEENNLLDIARGASVVSRTGEANLEQSAVHAIDGIRSSVWASPPLSKSDAIVFSLAAPSRIDRIGIEPPNNDSPPLHVRFERSADGTSWTEVSVLTVPSNPDPLIENVPPFEAEYLRVSTIDAKGDYSIIQTAIALGTELGAPTPRNFSGCWTINGVAARIEQTGLRVIGAIATSPPTWIEGATNGRVAKVMWMRGPTGGYGMLALSPDQQTLSGTLFFHALWHEHQGPSWFGERCRDASAVSLPRDIPSQLLQTAGMWSIYGLIFDERDQLIEAASGATLDAIETATGKGRFRILAHDFRTRDHAQNRRHTAARIASLRAALQKRGVDLTRIELAVATDDERDEEWLRAPLQRLLMTRFDLKRVVP